MYTEQIKTADKISNLFCVVLSLSKSKKYLPYIVSALIKFIKIEPFLHQLLLKEII